MRYSTILLLGIPGLSNAATLTVGVAGYTTIGDALLAASDGDVIEVEAGDYPEILTIDVDVDIVGLGGLAATSLSGTGGPAVEVDNAIVSLAGFTLNGTADRGVVVLNGAEFTGTDLDISGFTVGGPESGAGLLSLDSEVNLTDVIFDGNQSEFDGSAIQITDSLGVFTRITVTNNNTTSGDGALATDFSDVFIDDSLFQDNVSGDDGGAIEIDNDSVATITASDFIGNAGDGDGGAINAEDGGELTVDGCTFDTNIASDGFGGGNGGAIRVRLGTDSTLSNNDFTANSAEANGGAIDLDTGTHDLSGNTFTGNSAGNTAVGGAINIDNSGELNIDGDLYDGNTAGWGGAIYVRNDIVADIQFSTFTANDAVAERGGAIRANQGANGEITVSFSSFDANTATTTGGGIALAGFGLFSSINNTWSNNVGIIEGGAIYMDSVDDVYVEANTFCANDGGDEGGAARSIDSGANSHEWLGNVVVENVSVDFGGGLRFSGGGDPNIVNNTFIGNDSNDGGHIRVFQASADLVNNIFVDAVDGDGVSQFNTQGNRDFNLWFNNTANDVGGALSVGDLGAGAVFADADFVAYSSDGDCGNDDLNLNGGSPAIDAGDPGILDRDGSTSDIGAYGGPNGLPQDADGDGFNELQDCDDGDAAVNPGEPEICDGLDNNCDGDTDGADAAGAVAWYPDTDGDGYGDDAGEITACYDPGGMVNSGGDCDDGDANRSPGEAEVCDNLDNNCDGGVDEGVVSAWYEDLDGDGFGSGGIQIFNCDGGVGLVPQGGDCDDDEANVNPDASEVCDEIDNNCDGDIDEELGRIWYEDDDDDGYGVWDTAVEDCGTIDGYSVEAGDCDDDNPDINPGADDISGDDIDQDCDGEADGAGEGISAGGSKGDKDQDGCGCDSSSGSQSWLVLLGALLFVGRRSR